MQELITTLASEIETLDATDAPGASVLCSFASETLDDARWCLANATALERTNPDLSHQWIAQAYESLSRLQGYVGRAKVLQERT
jgi:hypothetical protein